MSKGMFFSLLAGIFVAIQGIFNTRAGEKIGAINTAVFVHGSGLILAVMLMIFFEKVSLKGFSDINPLYLTGGIMGVIIVMSVMQSIGRIGISHTITIIVVVQLCIGFLINRFGLFGEKIIVASPGKITGLVLMIIGLIVYQMR